MDKSYRGQFHVIIHELFVGDWGTPRHLAFEVKFEPESLKYDW
jgi:hypothetical protein